MLVEATIFWGVVGVVRGWWGGKKVRGGRGFTDACFYKNPSQERRQESHHNDTIQRLFRQHQVKYRQYNDIKLI
jgi:hypothetical protein